MTEPTDAEARLRTVTYETEYGRVTLLDDEFYIGAAFEAGGYWDAETLLLLRSYVDPDKCVIEVGAHCGTSTLLYSTFTRSLVVAFEPQQQLYSLLCRNLADNRVTNVIAHNKAVFCYGGTVRMSALETKKKPGGYNYGGLSLGADGANVECVTVDDLGLVDVGFIHIDAQGAENHILSASIGLIRRERPVIYFEDNAKHGRRCYDRVRASYPEYFEQSSFDIKRFCLDELKYETIIEGYNGGIDCLLAPK